MKYLFLDAKGVQKKINLFIDAYTESGEIIKQYLQQVAFSEGTCSEEIIFRCNETILVKDIEKLLCAHSLSMRTYVFRSDVGQHIEEEFPNLFEFIDCKVATHDLSYQNDNFKVVRFSEQTDFYDTDLKEKYLQKSSMYMIEPLKKSGLTFQFACKDPKWGICIFTSEFKKRLDKRVKLKYYEPVVEFIES